MQGSEEHARRDEEGGSQQCGEEREDDEAVADVAVADVDELEAHDVEAVVRHARMRQRQTVDVEHGRGHREQTHHLRAKRTTSMDLNRSSWIWIGRSLRWRRWP